MPTPGDQEDITQASGRDGQCRRCALCRAPTRSASHNGASSRRRSASEPRQRFAFEELHDQCHREEAERWERRVGPDTVASPTSWRTQICRWFRPAIARPRSTDRAPADRWLRGDGGLIATVDRAGYCAPYARPCRQCRHTDGGYRTVRWPERSHCNRLVKHRRERCFERQPCRAIRAAARHSAARPGRRGRRTYLRRAESGRVSACSNTARARGQSSGRIDIIEGRPF